MPYAIRKLPNKNRYRVYNRSTGRIHARSTTRENAKAQVRLLYMMEKRSQPKNQSGRRRNLKYSIRSKR
jgi:hypothetical protein